MNIKIKTESTSPRLRSNQYNQDQNKDYHNHGLALLVIDKK